jgi:hypothetical protein
MFSRKCDDDEAAALDGEGVDKDAVRAALNRRDAQRREDAAVSRAAAKAHFRLSNDTHAVIFGEFGFLLLLVTTRVVFGDFGCK